MKAQEKLGWIIFDHNIAKSTVAHTASYFGICPKTLYKWLKRFDAESLSCLEEKSRKPQKTREWMITRQEELNIVDLRKRNLELDKQSSRFYIKRSMENIYLPGRLKDFNDTILSLVEFVGKSGTGPVKKPLVNPKLIIY